MFSHLDDTIVAISSPPGIGVRGIIRLSGPAAFALAEQVFACDSGTPLSRAGGHRRLVGQVLWASRVPRDAPSRAKSAPGGIRPGEPGGRRSGRSAMSEPGQSRIPAEAYTFRAPASYTRQDVVELHLIGSPPLLAMVFERLTAAGARPAEAGEFTARAYFAGALDLTRVEGVAAIIHARTDAELRASEALLHGRLSQRSCELRDRLADLLALIEAEIDFVEEPIEFISNQEIIRTIDAIAAEVTSLLRNSAHVERLEAAPQVLLVGRPNAGKSTLFNCLTGIDRAIRSAIAGTTRDVLSAPVRVPGGEVLLLDSAGVEESVAGRKLSPSSAGAVSPDDPSEPAQAATRRALATADLVLLVIDASDEPQRALAELEPGSGARPRLVVASKIDRLAADERESLLEHLSRTDQALAVSAASGEGIDPLRAAIAESITLRAESHGAERLALSSRQRDALREAGAALVRARKTCENASNSSEFAELVAMEVREAMHALSLLVGEVATEELLGRIFSRFCIGK